MKYIEEVLDAIIPFVEEQLIKNGEFYPVAAAMKPDDEVALISAWDEDDKPLSDDLIGLLKKGLQEAAAGGEYKAVAIVYDVTVSFPDSSEKSNAIAALVENGEEAEAFTLYYIYNLPGDNTLEYGESWRTEREKEIFIH